MEFSPNLTPYNHQAEGLMSIVKIEVRHLKPGMKYIIDDLESPFYHAICKRVADGCAQMETLDGRPFRITQFSQVQPHRAFFKNTSEQGGKNFGDSWFNLDESFFDLFYNKDRSSHVLFDTKSNELCKYPTPNERAIMRANFVARGDWQHSFKFC